MGYGKMGGMGRWGEKMGGWEASRCMQSPARGCSGGLRGEVSVGVVENKMVGTYVIYEPTNMLSSDVRRVRDSNPRYP